MRWHYLGHAMWLLELDGTRVLFDPLLSDVHDDGLSLVVPPRELDRGALAPDFIVVSHRHPDHFDVDSLGWLAQRDPECVVLTADAFVAEVCRELGFHQVCVLETWQRVELAGGSLIATPSHGSAVEWGMAAIGADGVVWNHIDSVLGRPVQIERTLEVLRGAAGQGVHLHLARWCPVLEVAPQLAGRIGFPRGSYSELLAGLAALSVGQGTEEPRTCVAPAAVSVVPRTPHASLASNAFPVTRAQFSRDLAAAAPRVRQLELEVGHVLEVRQGEVSVLPGASPLARPAGSSLLPTFVPFEVPELVDPAPSPEDFEAQTGVIRGWLENRLAPRLAELSRSDEPTPPLSLCLELRAGNKPCGSVPSAVPWPGWTLRVSDGECHVQPGIDPDYDQLVAVGHSGLARVLRGDSSWGELLLSGQLRCSDRAFRVVSGRGRATALERVSWLPPVFVYAAPEYEVSFEAATRRRVARWRNAKRSLADD